MRLLERIIWIMESIKEMSIWLSYVVLSTVYETSPTQVKGY